jgi:hypothetical protein
VQFLLLPLMYAGPMKLNELVCPTCGLKCMTDAAYTTCASCQTTFYAAQSRSVDNPAPLSGQIVVWPTIAPHPHVPYVTWVGTVPEPITGFSISTGGTTDQAICQVWN